MNIERIEEIKEQIEPLSNENIKRKRANFPKETVEILTEWLINNLDNPYPDYNERLELCN